MSRRRHAALPGSEDLVPLVTSQREQLILSAITGGLGRFRSRSTPDLLRREAQRFVSLLAVALGRRGTPLTEAVDENVRAGAFAGAGPEEVPEVIGVWRLAVDAFSAMLPGRARDRRFHDALDRIEELAVKRAEKWEPERIDLVAIAASAGGIPALTQLLGTFEPDLPATVVVILHVSPSSPSLLPNVLGRATRMTVIHVVEGAVPHLGLVLVAPPGRHVVVEGSALRLVDGPTVHFVKPSADVLFESAAAAFGRHFASVVLSGTGADGATGTRAVRESGGVTFAQEPDTAEYPGMPATAIATGAVDHVMNLSQIGRALQRLVLRGRSAIAR